MWIDRQLDIQIYRQIKKIDEYGDKCMCWRGNNRQGGIFEPGTQASSRQNERVYSCIDKYIGICVQKNYGRILKDKYDIHMYLYITYTFYKWLIALY